jgi:hypothetical protein
LVGCRVVGRHLGLAHQADHLPSGQGIFECLQEEVADHALGLGAEHVERVRRGQIGIECALVGQHAHLWSVPVGDHQVMVPGQWNKGVDGHADMLLLDLGERNLPAFEQGIAAHGHDETHLSSRGWRPLPP